MHNIVITITQVTEHEWDWQINYTSHLSGTDVRQRSSGTAESWNRAFKQANGQMRQLEKEHAK